MTISASIAPPNSLLVISDQSGGKVPEITRDRRIWSTPTCIIVGCLAFMDGQTRVSMDNGSEIDPGGRPVFDGLLETPTRTVVISTVEHEPVLQSEVSTARTRIR